MSIYTIYKSTCLSTGKSYIGFDSRWPSRKREHMAAYQLEQNNVVFYNAIRKYGWEDFEWEVLYQSIDRDHTLNEMENYFIEQYRTYIHFEDCCGYNMTLGGDGTFGYKHTEHYKKQRSVRMKLLRRDLKSTYNSEEYCQLMKKVNKRIANDPIVKEKRYKKQRETNQTEETKKKRSIASKEHSNKPEIREGRSIRMKEKMSIEEERKKISDFFAKKYLISNPDNVSFEIVNLTKFCKDNGLSYTAISAVSQGKRNHHKHWRCKRID